MKKSDILRITPTQAAAIYKCLADAVELNRCKTLDCDTTCKNRYCWIHAARKALANAGNGITPKHIGASTRASKKGSNK